MLLGGAALVMVLVVAAAGYLYLFADTGPHYEIDASGPTAGGLPRDNDLRPGQHPAFATMMAALAAGGVHRDSGVTAVYKGSPQRDGPILFAGGTGDIGDPREYLTKAHPATETGTPLITRAEPDGWQHCGQYTLTGRTYLYCSWATETSMGFVAPGRPITRPAVDQRPLAGTMRRMRDDIETSDEN